ncbi:hydroxymethylbilane synthase [Spectribacter hydrogenoxidans]|uniref:Porphobilinogen deaminase n=1 Tax=Spectribacter hydrogenoxidans TaxID=3075608 RepID=A0ABU3BZ98_9GAMM|nr:hydroxymethylbilane synthase [Salinisphaera sp. W335]MDT0634632.1 hydroxymethylbilane synthase [Salinisphaera sp. W335]
MTDTPTARLRIATRKSELAMWQARDVQQRLQAAHPAMTISLVPLSTRGDRITDRPLAAIGGKGLFLKELEQALLTGEADIAVHSMKDVPAELEPEFDLPVVLAGGSPFDAFVSNRFDSPADLPAGARLGTSSLRRAAQLKHHRPDLDVASLRGNVGTRLGKLDAGEFDAIVLACAGLERLGMADRIRQQMPPEVCLPAIGQGVMGIEIRAGDLVAAEAIAALNDVDTHVRVTAERAVNARLAGSCHLPIAAFAELEAGQLRLRACVGAPDGSQLVADETTGPTDQAAALGTALAERLLAAGADRILAAL